jgi:intermediate cleaving peptidase 55
MSQVMRFAQPTSESGLTEHSLVAHFQYHTSLANSPRLAYVPVCASGASGLTIHYTKNNLPLHSGDLVVLDAGCEYGGYASDITRTFPVGGTFLSPQRDLYEAVLRVQRECIKLCTVESGMGLDDLHRKSCDLMRVELKELGFNLKGGELERSLYPHFVGHPLGIDLHDTSSFGRDAKSVLSLLSIPLILTLVYRIREGMVIVRLPSLSSPSKN